jgi:tetratricopeptide (TPR) repeat protein
MPVTEEGTRAPTKEDEQLALQLMQTLKRWLGLEHPDTLNSVTDLASIYRETKRIASSAELDAEVLSIERRVFGPEHPSTVMTMNNLALQYTDLERWEEAETLLEEAVDGGKKIFGPESPNTLAMLFNLASTYQNRERADRAEDMAREVVETWKKIRSEDDIATLASTKLLVAILKDQEARVGDAEGLQRGLVETSKRVYGPRHEITRVVTSELAGIYRAQGRVDEAKGLEAEMSAVEETDVAEEEGMEKETRKVQEEVSSIPDKMANLIPGGDTEWLVVSRVC